MLSEGLTMSYTDILPTGFAGIIGAVGLWNVWNGDVFPAEADPTGGKS